MNNGTGSIGSGARQGSLGESDGYSGGISLGTGDSYPLGTFYYGKVRGCNLFNNQASRPLEDIYGTDFPLYIYLLFRFLE